MPWLWGSLRSVNLAPFHHGTAGVSLKTSEPSTIGMCAQRWKVTVTCSGETWTVAGTSMRLRKIRRACASE